MIAHRSICLAALTVAAFSAASPAGAQTTPIVHGTVTDARTGEPIARARVSVGRRSIGTDEQGRFGLCHVPAAAAQLVVVASRYRPDTTRIQLSPGAPTDVRIALQPDTARSVSIFLDRPAAMAPGQPLPLYFLDGERVFILGGECVAPPPGLRVIDALAHEDIEAIHVLPRDEARERFGAEGEHGAVFIIMRAGSRP